MRHFAAVLFDKDGTLLDFQATWTRIFAHVATVTASRHAQASVAAQLLRVGGQDPDTGAIAPDSVLACGATPDIAKLWAQTLGLHDLGEFSAELDLLFNAMDMRRLAPVHQLTATMDTLVGAGLTLGVATMDTESMAHADIETLGITQHVRFACGADSGFGYKPGPGMVQAFCAAINCAPADVVMVGDTTHDLKMGRAAGVGLNVGVLTGAGDRRTLEPLADAVLAGLHELPELLGISDEV